MLLPLLIFFSRSAVVGIDIGSEVIRATILRPGKHPEVLLGPDSRRSFPSVLTVVPKNPSKTRTLPESIHTEDLADFSFVLNDAMAARKFPNYTIHHWSNFIAKRYEPSFLELASQRHFRAVASAFDQERLMLAGLLPEVIFHTLLDQVNASTKRLDANAAITSLVISVPKFWPQPERDSLRAIAKSKKLRVFVADSTRSICTGYAIENMPTFSKKPIVVAFFDLGASSIQISITKFSKRGKIIIEELNYQWSDLIGGRDFDVAIFQLLTENRTAALSPREEQLLLLESNKIKHRLTVDKSVSGTVECSDSGTDVSYTISRTDFENSIKPFLTDIEKLILAVKQNATYPIDRVQMLGGASRIPIVQETVKTAFDVSKVMFTMNAEESNSIGATYVGAIQSRDYKIADLKYKSLKIYEPMFRTDEGYFTVEDLSLPRPGEPTWLMYNATQEFPAGSSRYLVWSLTDQNSSLRVTKDGLYRFKNVTRKNARPWKSHVITIAEGIEKREKQREKLDLIVNKLELLLFDTKKTLEEEDDRLSRMATENERKALARAVEVTDRWFLSQKEFNQEVVEERLALLQDAVGSVMCRLQNDELLPIAETNMTKTLDWVNEKIRTKWANSKRKQKPSRRDVREILRRVEAFKLWYAERKDQQSRLGPLDNPRLVWSEVKARAQAIFDKTQSVEDELMGKGNKRNKDVYVWPPDSANVRITD
jgi:molecular chaperone DnaK (HSP70)